MEEGDFMGLDVGTLKKIIRDVNRRNLSGERHGCLLPGPEGLVLKNVRQHLVLDISGLHDWTLDSSLFERKSC